MYVVTVIVFFAIDIVWLAVVAKKLYQKEIGTLLKPDTNWFAAIVFYLLFIFGMVFFVVNPALERNLWTYALGAGALFGLITYATYDLTNLATMKNWPLKITIIDLVWGTFVSASTATLAFFIMQLFN